MSEKRDNPAGEYLASLTNRRPKMRFEAYRQPYWQVRVLYVPILGLSVLAMGMLISML